MRRWWDGVWPSLVALLGTVAVVGGLLLFFGRDVGGTTTVTAASTNPAVSGGDTPAATETTPPPPVDVKAPVVVLNGSSTRGLAARTGEALTAAGWTVAGTDNYNGDLAATTVFHPPELQPAAATLQRAFPALVTLAPSEPGMSADQLTLVMAGEVELGG